MSEQEFESYLRLLGRFLRLNEEQRETIGRELRVHMEERLEELLERGYTREEAITTILDEFGDAAALASDFGRIGRRRKWIMRTTVGTIGIAATILIVSFLLPENRPHVPAPMYSNAEESIASGKISTTQPADLLAEAPVYPSLESDVDGRIRQQLDAVVPSVDFSEGTTFQEAIKIITDLGKIPMDVNWEALDVMGIDKSTEILGIHLRNARLATALSRLLAKVSNIDIRINYEVIDGNVLISTEDDLGRHTIVRVYDCRDLIEPKVSEKQDQVALSLIEEWWGKHCDEQLSRETLVSVVFDYLKELREGRAEELNELIVTHVMPDTWKPDHATGMISIYDGLLVVGHTKKAHRQLIEMLTMLREAKAASATVALTHKTMSAVSAGNVTSDYSPN